jgi:2-oxo-4-hydroxy-4-carboxy-5-ureidoimidazoline decarboxylase
MQRQLFELNSMDRAGFVEAIGWVFENSPWVAERAWSNRPFSCLESLLSTMIAEVEAASEQEQLSLLRAHPDLGARVRVGTASAAEQAGAGMDSLNEEEFRRIQALNSAYRAKFGFPFLFAVKGSTKTDILRNLEQRGERAPETEYREALAQVYRIAEFRLRDTVL